MEQIRYSITKAASLWRVQDVTSVLCTNLPFDLFLSRMHKQKEGVFHTAAGLL